MGRALLVVSILILASSCGAALPEGGCNAINCASGCCDASGVCRSPSALSCGDHGDACTVCLTGAVCSLGTCVGGFGGGGVSTGGGSGGGGMSTGGGTGGGGGAMGGGGGSSLGGGGGMSTGGGTGGGGGGMDTGGGEGGGGGSSTGGGFGGSGGSGGSGGGFAGGLGGGGGSNSDAGVGCTTLQLPAPAYVTSKASDDGFFEADQYWGANGQQTLLFSQAFGVFAGTAYTFTSADNFNTCHYCVALFDDCTSLTIPYGVSAPTTCGDGYFVQSGTMTLDATNGNMSSGTFGATLTNLTLLQWDFVNDGPIFPGKCITVPSQSFNLSWP